VVVALVRGSWKTGACSTTLTLRGSRWSLQRVQQRGVWTLARCDVRYVYRRMRAACAGGWRSRSAKQLRRERCATALLRCGPARRSGRLRDSTLARCAQPDHPCDVPAGLAFVSTTADAETSPLANLPSVKRLTGKTRVNDDGA
jgi:hypothetical protein